MILSFYLHALALEDYKVADPWSGFGSIVPLTDVETSVKVPFVGSSAPDAIYDLQGHKLNSEPERGIYIKNGRKVVR